MPDDVLERLFDNLAGADLPVPRPAAVVARGRQRRRRARAQVLAGTAAVVLLLGLAVSELAGSHTPAQSPARHHQTIPPAVCPAAPDPALTAELQGALPNSSLTGTVPIALSPDGSTAYVLTTTDSFYGIVRENVSTGEVVGTVDALPGTDDDPIGGVAPDGGLIWYSIHQSLGGQNGDTTPMQLWSARTGTVTVLEPAGEHGAALSAPVFSGADHGMAAWEQADGSHREIVVANLRTGVTDVIARGQVFAPLFAGNALVWPAALPSASQGSHLIAVRADRLPAAVPVAVPVALRAAGQVSYISSAAGQVAYFSASLTELYYSPAPFRPARLVLRLRNGEFFGAAPPVLGPGYLGWATAGAASYVASTTSFATATLTNGTTDYGDVQAAGGFVLAVSSPDPKSGSSRVSVLSGATIEHLACSTARSSGR